MPDLTSPPIHHRRSQSRSRMQIALAMMSHRGDDRSRSTEAPSGRAASRDAGLLGRRSSRSRRGLASDLVAAVSKSLAQRLSDHAPVLEGRRARDMAAFVHAGATGSGCLLGLSECFRGALEAMELSDKSKGMVLAGAYHCLQADDVLLTAQTWRPLVVTSLLVAVSELCGRAEREQAIRKLRRSTAQWWSQDKADLAVQVFKMREAYVRDPLSHQNVVALCLKLQARSLEPASLGEDSSSWSTAFEFSCKRTSNGNGHVRASTRRSSRNGTRHAYNIERSNAILALSESRCRITVNNVDTSDLSVISI